MELIVVNDEKGKEEWLLRAGDIELRHWVNESHVDSDALSIVRDFLASLDEEASKALLRGYLDVLDCMRRLRPEQTRKEAKALIIESMKSVQLAYVKYHIVDRALRYAKTIYRNNSDKPTYCDSRAKTLPTGELQEHYLRRRADVIMQSNERNQLYAFMILSGSMAPIFMELFDLFKDYSRTYFGRVIINSVINRAIFGSGVQKATKVLIADLDRSLLKKYGIDFFTKEGRANYPLLCELCNKCMIEILGPFSMMFLTPWNEEEPRGFFQNLRTVYVKAVHRQIKQRIEVDSLFKAEIEQNLPEKDRAKSAEVLSFNTSILKSTTT